ncbi:MAG TPA: carbohydrate ABC transporter permease [Herpetosiphonaceae bacterium]|nr:carbohydrate ABC transporter permease [Herpetosiphonaceae bacterium]
MATITSQPVARQRKARGSEREQGLGLVGGTITYIVLTAMALISVFPFWWMIVASTRRSETILTTPPPLIPGSALMTNYNEMFQQINFWRAMFNSVFVGAVGTALVLFFCSLGGYAFSKFQFPGKNKLFGLMLATMMIPGILGIIPSFMLMKWLGWLDSYLPLLVPGAANAFGIFWMRQYIDSSIPNDLMDAARIDGAHEFRIYWNVILPVITPALAALAIMTFMGKWNDFFWPLLILKDPSKFTLPVALASLQNLYGNQVGVQMLGATMAILPVMIVFLMSARKFMAGLTAGAVKGV